MKEEEYSRLMRTLNQNQRKYMMNLLHVIKTTPTDALSFYHSFGGQPGVGKSNLIKSIIQCLSRLFLKESILVRGFTGIAASSIKGLIHHGSLPVTQLGDNFTPLSDDIANTIACKLHQLK